MEYKEIKPCKELDPFIHSYWELNFNLSFFSKVRMIV